MFKWSFKWHTPVLTPKTCYYRNTFMMHQIYEYQFTKNRNDIKPYRESITTLFTLTKIAWFITVLFNCETLLFIGLLAFLRVKWFARDSNAHILLQLILCQYIVIKVAPLVLTSQTWLLTMSCGFQGRVKVFY